MSQEKPLLNDLFIAPDFDNARVNVSFAPPAGLTSVRWEIVAGDKIVATGNVEPQSSACLFAADLPGFRAWTLDDPFLYQIVLTLTVKSAEREAKGVEQRIVEDFGMRKFHTDGRRLYMNNLPLYVRGVIRGREAHDHNNLLGLDEEEFYAKFIRNAKALGFNFIRFHSRVPPDAYFRAADRLGMLTHIEVRKYYGKYQKERDLMDHDPVLVRKEDWVETILHVRNHASLMVYCLGNEINKPGRNPQVKERAAELRQFDSTRLFIDTCARGEFDRDGIDFDVQHMGYFAPFGPNYDMFDTTRNWAIFGSVTGKQMVVRGDGFTARREVPVKFPVLAHEVGHYVALRDLDALKRKFKTSRAAPACENDPNARSPWWIDELIKLRRLKGLDAEYAQCVKASIRYQYVWYKQVFESIRRSPILNGFNFLQLADTDRYENANGLLDCFDDIKPTVKPAEYLRFNSDAVLVADLPRRTFFEGAAIKIPLWLSNYAGLTGEGVLSWKLLSEDRKTVKMAGEMDHVDLTPGLTRVATVDVTLPKSAKPQAMKLTVSLKPNQGAIIANEWNLWSYPNRPEKLPLRKATVALHDINLVKRYPQVAWPNNLKKPEKLMIVDRFSDEVFAQLARGGDVLMLWRVPETRDRSAKREKYYMPSTWDRFKGIIWDRGHNCGGFSRPHAAIKGFPTDGFLDFQFAGIIDDCDKLSLDGFPVRVDPIVQGVDKAARDRYDVYTFKLSELQPDWTMRRFAYLFDLRVDPANRAGSASGAGSASRAVPGRLMICGFNLTGLDRDVPEAVAMFESLIACVTAKSWRPKARIGVDELKAFLAEKGRQPRIKERMMTQYWQLDAEPLESAQYWKDAEAWIRKG